MPKYLFEVKYTLDGMKGLRDKGGTARVAASRALVEEAGGTIESFYFAFGGRDAFIIADLPDNVAGAALGLIVGASGGVIRRPPCSSHRRRSTRPPRSS